MSTVTRTDPDKKYYWSTHFNTGPQWYGVLVNKQRRMRYSCDARPRHTGWRPCPGRFIFTPDHRIIGNA